MHRQMYHSNDKKLPIQSLLGTKALPKLPRPQLLPASFIYLNYESGEVW